MSWLLDSNGLEVLYRALVRSSMEYACLGWGGAANKHLALFDKVQGRAVRLIRDSGAGQEPRLHSLQHRRDVAGLTVMYKVHQQRVPHLHTVAAPTAGPGYHKGRCSSPCRATTAPLPYLAPPASVRLRLRRLVECSPCLAATPWRYNCARVQGTCECVAAQVNARRSQLTRVRLFDREH
ncbi:hypothetical protein GWK47_032881 [Chionoecetes opilio]|uniref:Uncharacterized protein n=1 Tax=Chionoecetes opilio TaxID=41210 RepID=A0A8J4YK27_CHIOP|nr:hypothetical protein GWK47_032881 [Chionoecetes opilio]